MKGVESHPDVQISNWHDALIQLEKVKRSHPNARTVTLLVGEQSLDATHKQALVKAVEEEKIVAAQGKFFDFELLVSEKDVIQPRIIPCITDSISVFQAQPLFDYLENISEELGHKASPKDISIILNRMGYSSAEVPLDLKHNSGGKAVAPDLVGQIPRAWDAYIEHVQNEWNKFNIDPIYALKSLFYQTDHPLVLLDLSTLEPRLNGTSRNAIDLLNQLELQLSNGELSWYTTAIIPESAISYFGLHFRHIKIVNSPESLEGNFHLGLSVTPTVSMKQDLFMGRRCLKWVVLHLDIIALRGLEFLSQNTNLADAVQLYLEHADQVICISESSRKDVFSYFGIDSNNSAHCCVIPEGNPLTTGSGVNPDLPPYVLVLGNDYPHKQVALAVKNLTQAGYFVVSLSSARDDDEKHLSISPGSLSEAELEGYLKNASALVFPSMYEGYGLPIAEAASLGKPLILWDTAISHEVSEFLGVSQHNYFCRNMTELVSTVNMVFQKPDFTPPPTRKLEDFNKDVLTLVAEELSTLHYSARLNNRWKTFNLLERVMHTAQAELTEQTIQKHWQTRMKKFLRFKVS